ncbi:MAG: DNA translocase FtsK [Armatimonadota bacterium]|nr:DNA translocase FtsK [Armatimonadota bacterium]
MVRKAKRQRTNSYLAYDIVGVTLLFAGPIALVSLMWRSNSGVLGNALNVALMGFLGAGSYALPLLLVALGVLLLVGPLKVVPKNSAIGALILYVVVITWLHLRVSPPRLAAEAYFQDTRLYAGGGVVGAAASYALRHVIGNVCSYLFLSALAIISVLLITDVPVAHVLRKIGDAVATAIDTVNSRRERSAGRLPAERRVPQIERNSAVGFDRSAIGPRANGAPREVPIVTGQANSEPAVRPPQTVAERPNIEPEEYGDFKLPPLTLLKESPPAPARAEAELRGNIEIIERTLQEFNVAANVVEIAHGPTVTRYEIQLAGGIKVNKIVSLADNLAMSLAAIDVRVEAPIPGKSAIGVEVPNKTPALVALRDALNVQEFWDNPSKLTFSLGKDVSGSPKFADLARMPHMLIGGATNSGKSICLNTLIASLLFRATPEDVKFLLIDPKRVELSLFEGIPHLAYPVVKDVRQAAGILRAATKEMENRYDKFSRVGTRNIDGYNKKVEPKDKMYYLVIVVDELADMMMQAGAEVESSICRLAQLARATGIHLVIATQRPSVDIITGTIKANISSRLAFAVSSQVDSRTILDMNGAERLVGRGDMLFMPIDAAKPTRIQGPYISEEEIAALVQYLKEQRSPHYCLEPAIVSGSGGDGDDDASTDELYEDAVRLIVMKGHASTSMLQVRFKIGYNRAARLIDAMERQRIVGPLDGAKPREVLIGKRDMDQMFGGPSGLPFDNEDEDLEE